MEIRDARSLPAGAQEDLRRKAVQAVRQGMTQTEAARIFGVSRGAVNQWMRRYQEGGARALAARRRGRPPEARLDAAQRAAAIRLITGRCPDQLRLPFALWTREAVQELLAQRFGVEVSVWTVGRYLRGWGLTPQKPVRRAYEQNPELVRRWLEVEYPAIRAQAQREGAQIQWGDEMGFRSDHQAGRSYGRRGQTPVIPGTGERFRGNMISTITNRGQLYFMVFTGRFNGKVCIAFLRRLLRQVPQKIFLILDRHPVHKAAEVEHWLAARADRLRLFWLPAYSPELNPDELLNQDVKTNAVGRQRPRNREEMLGQVRSYLHSTQRRPDLVRNYFQGRHVQYAAL